MKAVREGETLTLSGPPRNVTATVQLDDASQRVVRVAVKLADGPSVLRAYVRPYGGGMGELRLKLPPATSPGTYRGEAVIGERTPPDRRHGHAGAQRPAWIPLRPPSRPSRAGGRSS